MGIKIKNRAPKSTDFSGNAIVINSKEGSIFYKSSDNEIYKLQGDKLSTEFEEKESTKLLQTYNGTYILANSDNNEKFIPFGYDGDITYPLPYNQLMVPYSGRIVKMLYQNGSWEPATTTIKFRRGDPDDIPYAVSDTDEMIVIETKVLTNPSKRKVHEVYFDRGEYKYHGRVKAFAETLRKNGLKF